MSSSEKRVPLRIDFYPAVSGKRVPECFAMVGKRICVGVAELTQQPCRALDIGEEEGDGTGREDAHSPE
jgi:hypothetical protein